MTKKPLPDLGGVDSRDLTTQVLARLRQALISNAIPPGEHLVESDIAAQMGVSRAPVREAIRMLDQEGLVEYFPYRGAVSVGMSESELDVCYELRATIESHAGEQLTGTAGEDIVAALEELVDRMEDDRDREAEHLIALDVDFHRLLVESAGHHFLLRRWENLNGIMRVRILQSLERPGELSAFFRQDFAHSHREILEAIRQDSPTRTQAVIREHILSVAPMMRSQGNHLPT